MLDRRQFLGALGGAAAASAGIAAPAKKPNFVVILADDMGYSDAGCYGGEVATPNLDRLAATGLRFTQCYSTARCGPSRGSLMTGYYAQQTASDGMTKGKIAGFTHFIPEFLKPLGYRSYHSGKWHLKLVTGKDGVGFDHSYTMLDENRFFTQQHHELDGQKLPTPGEGYYSTTAIMDYGVRFLKEHARDHANNPFFLYLAPHSPHFPLQAPQEDIARYKDKFAEGWDTARERKWQRMQRMGLINCPLAPLEANMWTHWNSPDKELIEKVGKGEVMRAVPWSSLNAEQKDFQRTKMAIHAAMITRMDLDLGKVLDQLKAMNADRDTVVVFLSDNGASSEQLIRADGHDKNAPLGSGKTFLGLGPGWASNSNAPFRLHKSWVNEGGISSPLIVNWPNGIKDQNKLRHNPCHFVDVLPTLVDLAGGNAVTEGAPPRPGKSLASAFQKDNTALHDYLYFNHNNNRAIRKGDMKLIATGEEGSWELYDLSKDRSEQHNLVAKQPDLAKKMGAEWKEHDDEFLHTREKSPECTKKTMNKRG